MFEMNMEVLELAIEGLSILNEYSGFDDTFDVNLVDLNFNDYMYPEDWLRSVLINLFNSKLEEISHSYVEDGYLVFNKLEEYDKDIAIYYYENFREIYGYLGCDEDLLEREDFQEQHDADFQEYFLNLGMRHLSLSSPLITLSPEERHRFKEYIPAMVEDRFSLSRCILITCDIVKLSEDADPTISIYYIEDGMGEFVDYYDEIGAVQGFVKLLKSAKANSSKNYQRS